jgi:Reverse transcriptase (RNA-dependent DNA polymerase)
VPRWTGGVIAPEGDESGLKPSRAVHNDKLGSFRGINFLHFRNTTLQTAAHLTLVPILEPEFEAHSYAYRPGRSVGQALAAVRSFHEAGFTHVVDADIRAYFDNVPHLSLLAALSDYVPERAFLHLVGQWLDLSADPEKGLPQGAPVSPILANLYLDSLDEKIAAAGFRIVRYADDFVILCRSRKRAEKALELVAKLLARLHLEIHPEKTALRTLNEGYVFLGQKMGGTGLAGQIEALADVPTEAEVPAQPSPGRVISGQLGTLPVRRIGNREIVPKTPTPARTAADADAPWQVAAQQAYLTEGDDGTAPEDFVEPGGWQGAPCNVVNRKEMQGLKEQPVVLGLGTAGRKAGPESIQRGSPVIIIHLQRHRQHSLIRWLLMNQTMKTGGIPKSGVSQFVHTA